MKTIPNFKNFDVNETVTAVGFGMNSINNFGLGGGTPQTGYSMSPVAGIVGQSADAIGSQAYEYETNENSDHTAEGYLTEAKKHISESIDKAYEGYSAGVKEAMVQVAGKDKPSGAKVLASVIVDHLIDKKIVTRAAEKKLAAEIQDIIIKSTF